jgi:hypothetical protein
MAELSCAGTLIRGTISSARIRPSAFSMETDSTPATGERQLRIASRALSARSASGS